MDIKFERDAHGMARAHLEQLIGLNVEWRADHDHGSPLQNPGGRTYMAGHGRLLSVSRTVPRGWLVVRIESTVDDFETFEGVIRLVFDAPKIGFNYDSFQITVY